MHKARFGERAKEYEAIKVEPLERWDNARIAQDFDGWIAANIPMLTAPMTLQADREQLDDMYGSVEEFGKRQDPKTEALRAARSKSLERVVDNYQALIDTFEELVKTGDEKTLKAIKRFFKEDGKYTLEHVTSIEPTQFALNLDTGKKGDNATLKSPYLPHDFCVVQFILNQHGKLFDDKETMEIFCNATEPPKEKEWYKSSFCRAEGNSMESVLKNLSALDKVARVIEDTQQFNDTPAVLAAEEYVNFIREQHPNLSDRLSILKQKCSHITKTLLEWEMSPPEVAKSIAKRINRGTYRRKIMACFRTAISVAL